MSQKCSDYNDVTNKCNNGFIRVHPVCWGGVTECQSCGSITSIPDCMNEDLPKQLSPKITEVKK